MELNPLIGEANPDSSNPLISGVILLLITVEKVKAPGDRGLN
jgi:hypothetical protein